MNTRFSPLEKLAASAPDHIKAVLSHPTDMQKLGVKGPGLLPWSQTHDIALPENRYDTLPVGQHGVLARVGNDELILECADHDALLPRFEEALLASDTGVYRLDQQSLTLVLSSETALLVLAQTCGVDFSNEPVDRIIYTRVAGASCVVLPRLENGQQVYRLWIDYTLAPYLWETLAEIIAELGPS